MDFTKITTEQYQLLASRRESYDLMLWQTPVISLTAQAFLFTIALGTGPALGRVLASVLALAAGLASLHLLGKHRTFELHYANLLRLCERGLGLEVIHERPTIPSGLLACPAYTVWKLTFILFAVAAVGVAVDSAIEYGTESSTPNTVLPAKSTCQDK